jgi:hypothetical protein
MSDNMNAETSPQQDIDDFPLPPASFSFLVLSLKTQAELQMGLIHFGEEEDRPEPEFRVARHTIDILAMLQEKTKGNLSMDEQRLIENSVTELRFRYVQAFEAHKSTAMAHESQEPKADGNAQA